MRWATVWWRTRSAGKVVYNEAYDVLQACLADGTWQALGPINCPAGDGCSAPAGPTGCDNIGDTCSDSTIYAGLSPDGNVKMYTTPADEGSFAWNNGNSSGYVATGQTDRVTGETNTANLITIDSDSGTGGTQPHQAAQACADLDAHGHQDWYLPALDELSVLWDNRVAIGGFDTDLMSPGKFYWASAEFEFDDAQATNRDFSDASWFVQDKSFARSVRCVRR